MNCIAIDDEPLALNVIKEFCQKIDFINLIETYTNAIDAFAEIMKNNLDVIFLDVEMPNITGFEFIKSLPNPPLIILTTAFSKYALNGFEMNAIDFLLKPISFDKFMKAVTKASIQLAAKNENIITQKHFLKDLPFRHISNHPQLLNKVETDRRRGEQENKSCEYLFIKVDYSMVKVCLNEIKYIEGLKDYIKIFINEKYLITKSTIKHIESKLPPGLFARVHKSYIISIDKIDKIEYNHIFIGQKKIPIGMQFKDSFYTKIDHSRL